MQAAPIAMPVAVECNGCVKRCIGGESARLIKSPNAFARDLLLRILARARRERREPLSCIELVDPRRVRIRLVPCDSTNIKITTPLDWEIARRAILPMMAGPGELAPRHDEEGRGT
jgi:2-C-methyl-D-erythritol 4-phosphate cytidylyltransferase